MIGARMQGQDWLDTGGRVPKNWHHASRRKTDSGLTECRAVWAVLLGGLLLANPYSLQGCAPMLGYTRGAMDRLLRVWRRAV